MNIQKISNSIVDRASFVKNERSDLLSVAARKILDIEVYIAEKIKKTSLSSNTTPVKHKNAEQFELEPAKVEMFFEQLNKMKRMLILKMAERMSRYAPAEEIPNVNMCGYTAHALVEAFREKNIEARVVYGIYKKDSKGIRHYWTEITTKDGTKVVLDATYGQFNTSIGDEVISYESEKLKDYNLQEFWPENSEYKNSFLKEHGVLPIRDDMHDDIVPEYEKLVKLLI